MCIIQSITSSNLMCLGPASKSQWSHNGWGSEITHNSLSPHAMAQADWTRFWWYTHGVGQWVEGGTVGGWVSVGQLLIWKYFYNPAPNNNCYFWRQLFQAPHYITCGSSGLLSGFFHLRLSWLWGCIYVGVDYKNNSAHVFTIRKAFFEKSL